MLTTCQAYTLVSYNEELILYFVPSLVATLLNREKADGRPLTEAEVLAIRDTCPCIAMRVEEARQVTELRGYEDIDPERCLESLAINPRRIAPS